MSKPTELPKEVENIAKDLRNNGYSYNKIVEELSSKGATERWVKRICKGVVVGQSTNEYKAVEQISKLAVRKEGVKPSEINSVLFEIYGVVWDDKKERNVLNLSQKDKNTIKRKVTKRCKDLGKDALFTPEWLQVEHCKESKEAFYEAAQMLHETLTEIEMLYKRSTGNTDTFSVSSFLYDVCSVNIKKMAPEGNYQRFETILDKIHRVEDKVTQKVLVVERKETGVEFYTPY